MQGVRRTAIVALLGLATIGAASPEPAPVPIASSPLGAATGNPLSVIPSAEPSFSAVEIYLRAARAMKTEPMPAYVVFDEAVVTRNLPLGCTADGTTLSIKHGDYKGSYHIAFRVSDGAAVAQDLATGKTCKGALLIPAGKDVATLGAPTAEPSSTPSPGTDSAGVPSFIGSVRVETAKYYRITYLDRESFEGHDVDRLGLQAYSDSNEHPLTEMLVDRATSLVRRVSGSVGTHLVIASGFAAGTVTFDRIGDYWVVRDEDFEIAFNALLMHGRGHVVVHGSAYSYPSALPDVPFPSASPTMHPRHF